MDWERPRRSNTPPTRTPSSPSESLHSRNSEPILRPAPLTRAIRSPFCARHYSLGQFGAHSAPGTTHSGNSEPILRPAPLTRAIRSPFCARHHSLGQFGDHSAPGTTHSGNSEPILRPGTTRAAWNAVPDGCLRRAPPQALRLCRRTTTAKPSSSSSAESQRQTATKTEREAAPSTRCGRRRIGRRCGCLPGAWVETGHAALPGPSPIADATHCLTSPNTAKIRIRGGGSSTKRPPWPVDPEPAPPAGSHTAAPIRAEGAVPQRPQDCN